MVYVQKFLKYIDSVSNTRLQSNDWVNDPKPKSIIIDDLLRESSSGGVIVNLFSKGSHHNNLSVILITQNIFHQGKGIINVTYL